MFTLLILLLPLTAILVAGSLNEAGSAFIIELDEKATTLDAFAQNTRDITYKVRHVFNTPGVFTGISIDVSGSNDLEGIKERLDTISGVIGVAKVLQYELPSSKGNFTVPQDDISSLMRRGSDSDPEDLGYTLRMGGVDKVHAMGNKGKGVKIGFIDTGIYYKHPALGGGFGDGKKIAGGYSFITDDGDEVEGSDPFSDCAQSDHATHVAGILGMDPLQYPEGLPISGVAPEASLYAYRIYSCGDIGGARRGGESDLVIKAMLKAMEDGVDILSIVAQSLREAGIAMIVAMGNDASNYIDGNNLYLQTLPSELSSVISVGSIANSEYPLVFTAQDSYGTHVPFASLKPISAPEGLDVYVPPGDTCGSFDWEGIYNDIEAQGGNINATIIAVRVAESCQLSTITCCGSIIPPYLLGFFSAGTNPYLKDHESILPYRFNAGATRALTIIEPDADTFYANYEKAGGYMKYRLFFNNSTYTSTPQYLAGIVDGFSDWGPIRLTYELKPEISAPGGHILSTLPESIGSYGILSGTSMSTPYIAGCFALVKSQFPDLSIDEILALLQMTARPTPWAFDTTMLATTAQQGAGLVNVYDAITSSTRIYPGQLAVTDNNRTSFGLVNITVENNGEATQTYKLGHRGAGYVKENNGYMETNQLPNFGTPTWYSPTFVLEPGESKEVAIRLSYPPLAVPITRLPLFSGFIDVIPSTGANLSIPYIGPAYSPYNIDHIFYSAPTDTLPGQPYMRFGNGSTDSYDFGFSSITSSGTYTLSVVVTNWSNLLRADIVPANTTLAAHFYSDNATVPADYEYLPSAEKLSSTLFNGEPSYGNLWKSETLNSPSASVFLQGTGFTVSTDSGANVTLGNGDYRLFFSVLRWGGDGTLLEDYDTWLGPIVRFQD
ncbi:subtilisin-like protein [Trichoderma citrinoviride]|uniref:Subtilisin-like protein n=1 Tax=Trichoderma citrinoviride TaxID=58853 RepID=A0A2T4BGE9_9HYPO|nr:subtilisin-like protein [Trichoderma citrinoviride]PTB68404.1 subtilisin-like protein [Trichoderma citrinoviride]